MMPHPCTLIVEQDIKRLQACQAQFQQMPELGVLLE
jgi:hypothetical protein